MRDYLVTGRLAAYGADRAMKPHAVISQLKGKPITDGEEMESLRKVLYSPSEWQNVVPSLGIAALKSRLQKSYKELLELNMKVIEKELESLLAFERVKFDQLPDFPSAALTLAQCSKELVQELQHTEYSYARIFSAGLDLNGQLQKLRESLVTDLTDANDTRRRLENLFNKRKKEYWKEQLKKYNPWILPQSLLLEYVQQKLQSSQVCQVVQQKNERCMLKFSTFVQKQGIKWYTLATKKKALATSVATRRSTGWDKFFAAVKGVTPNTYSRLHQAPSCPLQFIAPISQRWQAFIKDKNNAVFQEFTRPVSRLNDIDAVEVEKALQEANLFPQGQMRSGANLAAEFMQTYARSVDDNPAQELDANEKDIFYTDRRIERREKRARRRFFGESSPQFEKFESPATPRSVEDMRQKLRTAMEEFLPRLAQGPDAARIEQEERFFILAERVYQSKVSSFQKELEGRVAEAMKMAKYWFEKTMLDDEELIVALDRIRSKDIAEKRKVGEKVKKLEMGLAVVRGRPVVR